MNGSHLSSKGGMIAIYIEELNEEDVTLSSIMFRVEDVLLYSIFMVVPLQADTPIMKIGFQALKRCGMLCNLSRLSRLGWNLHPGELSAQDYHGQMLKDWRREHRYGWIDKSLAP